MNALIVLLLLVLSYSINNRQAVEEVHQTVIVTQMEMDILNRLNAPVESIRIIIAWEKAEGADMACNNPFNTSLDAPGATTINSHGVKCYPDYNTGLEATIATLSAAEYAPLVAAIQQADESAFVIALGNSRWGTDADLVRQILEEHTTYVTEHHEVMYSNLDKADIIPNWQQHINAGFYTVNCAYWGPGAANQPGCQHLGTDIGGNGEGTPVYAPYSGTVVSCQDNGDGGSYIGWWLIYNTDNGAEFLINHFRHVYDCTPGARITAGQELGTMRADANHVHVQVRVNGSLVDFEEFWRIN